MRLMAARGVLPGAKPAHIVTAVVALTTDASPKVAEAARKTLGALPPPILTGALEADLETAVVLALTENYKDDANIVEKLLRMPRMDEDALVLIAASASEAVGELVATNETLLLKYPKAIEKLYMNKRVRMSTADRLLELAVRNGLELDIPAFAEAAQAIQGELIPEPTVEPTYDDILFVQAEEVASLVASKLGEDDDTHERDDEGEEVVREEVLPLHAAISQMTVTQKIRRALLGNSAERMLLVREKNRLVATAAASSPMMNENDAARIAASRNVIDDVLRIIARNKEFTRNYQVKLNLVYNPRTPFTFSARMIPHLRASDLRSIMRSKNVPSAVQSAVRQHVNKKKPR
jgi:hypothetical protein